VNKTGFILAELTFVATNTNPVKAIIEEINPKMHSKYIADWNPFGLYVVGNFHPQLALINIK
jgi:hypothetical protein